MSPGLGEVDEGLGAMIPGLRDDNVVDGLVAFAEAGEADLDDHVCVTNLNRVAMAGGKLDGSGD